MSNKETAIRVNSISLRDNPSWTVQWIVQHIMESPGFKLLNENAKAGHELAKERLDQLTVDTQSLREFLETRGCKDSESSDIDIDRLNHMLNDYIVNNNDIITHKR